MRIASILLTCAIASSGAGLIAGCDDTTAEHKEVQTKSDGTVVKHEEKTTESPNGAVTKTETKSVDHPDK